MRVKVRGSEVRGGFSNETRETVTHRFRPLHLCTCSHSAASHRQLRQGRGCGGSQTGKLSISIKARGPSVHKPFLTFHCTFQKTAYFCVGLFL